MEGQRALITDFIYENQAALYRLAFAYTRSREAALDIVQDTVVQALTHAASLRSAEAVKPWVYRILVNESLAYLRRNKRFLLVEELPERERQVLLLRYYKNLTQIQCARVLGVSQVQISRLERRAVDRLRKILCEEEVF